MTMRATTLFLDLLTMAEEDYMISPEGKGKLRWTFTLTASELIPIAKALGYIDLHDALVQAAARADEKNLHRT
jgi:hypothetical protein